MFQKAAFVFVITGEAQTECKRERKRKPNGKRVEVERKQRKKMKKERGIIDKPQEIGYSSEKRRELIGSRTDHET